MLIRFTSKQTGRCHDIDSEDRGYVRAMLELCGGGYTEAQTAQTMERMAAVREGKTVEFDRITVERVADTVSEARPHYGRAHYGRDFVRRYRVRPGEQCECRCGWPVDVGDYAYEIADGRYRDTVEAGFCCAKHARDHVNRTNRGVPEDSRDFWRVS